MKHFVAPEEDACSLINCLQRGRRWQECENGVILKGQFI